MSERNFKYRRAPISHHADPTVVAKALLPALLFASIFSPSTAQAQQVLANGTSETAAGTYTLSLNSFPVFYALNNGQITTTAPVFITSTGQLSTAVQSIIGSTVTIQAGSTITTTGENSVALAAQSNGTIDIFGTTITTTTGAFSRGILSLGGSTVTLTDSTVDVQASYGMEIGSASVIFNNTTLEAFGFGADLNGNAYLNLENGSSITTNEAGAHGVDISGVGNLIEIDDSSINVHGAGAAVFHSAGDSSLEIEDSTLSSDAGAVFEVVSGTQSATVNTTTITGLEIMNVSAGASLYVSVGQTTLTGMATTAAGGTGDLGLYNSSVWNVTGDSSLTNLTNSASVVEFTPPSSSAGPFKTLTVRDYLGIGGRIAINTVLGGDGSPSDKVVIDGGTAFGTSVLAVNNVGGTGALTQVNGILVVDAINGGTTVPGLFSLAGPVTVGPYEYSLYRGSVDSSNPNAWYLRSVLDCSLDPSAPVCNSPGPSPTPNYRQETSLYAAVPAMTLLYGRMMLDSLHERRGTAVSAYAEGAPNAAWARVIGQHGDRDGDRSGIYGSGPKYDYDFWAFQGGMDLYRDGDVGTSRNHAGAFFAIGHGSGDVDHFGSGKAGENSFMAYSWGAYWTHYTPNNAYVDALLLGSWYDIDAKSNRIDKLKTDGGAFGASLEGGYPVYTGPGGFSIEPQAQLAFQTINLNNGSDVSAQVHFDNVNSLVGRVGIRFAQDFGAPTWLTGAPSTFTAWVRPNFWYEFLGDPKTKFATGTGFVPFAADMGGTTFEINTGFSTEVADGTAIYANASYLVGLGDHADGNAYDGKLGVKVAW
ncbi:autotransporter outer membrane beta-barrel domain-containing protein [Hyphomicrobium sp. D-2]|uniref:autotransporter family protein n=1 Tax=Hyphomicrobium sp. D-2 TaxID=3041621 RepID=UPI002453D5F6|nr:autotransporter outer membrane beta-barrel domain-containing protein [Hyphomicrobium sp. D-2]MDH4982881.1 autotransporter outer membrane beta-barrel domain-containing protein [Hyphomicrobium sp. D-2]